jgi:hypothetical protein
MARTTRQTVVFGVEDWKRIYQTYREADFQSYDFETLRKVFVDYLRQYYPETFNDYVESSEFIALLDVMAFMGQALSFRNDLNTRENYLDTAERRDSVVKLADLVAYTPKRNQAAEGLLKVFNVTTTENIADFNGINLSNITVNWNDPTNLNWQEQFTTIINAALVNSQKIGKPSNRATILDIRTDEYTINLVPGFLPVVAYNSTVDGITMPFEAVSASTIGESYVYEPSPLPDGKFNVLFRNDQLGFDSNNTGYFFLFKQGVLTNVDFNLAEAVVNRTVPVNVEGINNKDHWLFQLDTVGNVQFEWEYVESTYAAAVEQLAPEQRKLYSITSRANDQITLTFGDGVFSTVPVGFFRCYVRASNGLTYIINPEEMQSVVIPITYVSRTGNREVITFTCGITQPVSNALGRETLSEIKQRAPARYYTQNRMVNGEDYNNFPFTLYNSILKSKAVNRASIGTSRYLDLVDNTGKYSSTNSFGSDGALWQENILPTFLFTWSSINEIASVIINQVEPLLIDYGLTQFYNANFPRPNLSGLVISWQQSTTIINETTGYFKNASGTPYPIGPLTTSNARFIAVGSLVKFEPPVGYFFDANNRLKLGTPTLPDEKIEIWASPTEIFVDGTNQGQGNFSNGSGPVVFNNFIPTGAIPTEVIPLLVTDLTNTVENEMIAQTELYRDFGLGYDSTGAITGTAYTWYVISSTNLDANGDWSQQYAGNTLGANLDASWLIKFTTDGETYTVTSRALAYYFGSVLQTRFFFESGQRIYDSRTGTVISDFVKVLKVNSQPDSSAPLYTDYSLSIVGQPVQSDGYVDDFQVLVSYQDIDNDGIADNPDFFDAIVAPAVNTNSKLVFFEKTVDFDNLQRYLLVNPARVNANYATEDAIELVKLEFVDGQIFYATQEEKFFQLVFSGLNTRTLVDVTNDWLVRTGRNALYYQYRHNAPLTARIDPGTTNIIDIYVVTQSYYTQYLNWIQDTTGTVANPLQPTLQQLTNEYQGLDQYKMISDNVLVNSVTFKPLFGPKAALDLQATIKVIKAPNAVVSDSEIKNTVVSLMNSYFTIETFDFGDTFYFSELAGYIHKNAGGIVSSVVLVPLDPQKYFGDLYEIRSAPNEIFVNAAGVENVQVISALTSNNLRTAPGSGVI